MAAAQTVSRDWLGDILVINKASWFFSVGGLVLFVILDWLARHPETLR
jgi:hypothetical protein